jgi:hypothetical protein
MVSDWNDPQNHEKNQAIIASNLGEGIFDYGSPAELFWEVLPPN